MSQYLDLAYAVVVDERVRRGTPLFDALDQTREYAASGTVVPLDTSGGNNTTTQAPPRGTDMSVEAQNDAALETLVGAMSGIQGGFG